MNCKAVVSMPSRADISFLLLLETIILFRMKACQCPLGLIPHFYPVKLESFTRYKGVSMPSRAYTSFLRFHSNGTSRMGISSVNALSGLYIISTYPFKNLGFMRFPEPVFTGIYQNILTTAVFRAC